MALGAMAPAAAQDFPSRTVKIVMGFGPGGLGDILALKTAAARARNLHGAIVGRALYDGSLDAREALRAC